MCECQPLVPVHPAHISRSLLQCFPSILSDILSPQSSGVVSHWPVHRMRWTCNQLWGSTQALSLTTRTQQTAVSLWRSLIMLFIHKNASTRYFPTSLPRGRTRMRTTRSALALFGYGNESPRRANEGRVCCNVTVKHRSGGGSGAGLSLKQADEPQRSQCREKQRVSVRGNFVSMKLRKSRKI